MARDLGLDPLQVGYIFSASSWAYTLDQLPGSWLLDKFGSKKSLRLRHLDLVGIYLLPWLCPFLRQCRHNAVHIALHSGFCRSAGLPANSSIVSAWFPVRECGTRLSVIFNISQYAALVVFNPLLGWIIQEVSWEYVFIVMGVVGIVLSAVWVKTMYSPLNHPRVSQSELEYLRAGGALVEMDAAASPKAKRAPQLGYIKQLLSSRMLLAFIWPITALMRLPGSSCPGFPFIGLKDAAC